MRAATLARICRDGCATVPIVGPFAHVGPADVAEGRGITRVSSRACIGRRSVRFVGVQPSTPRADLPTGSEPLGYLVAGVCLTVGFLCAAAAALHPALSEVWTTGGARAVSQIGAGRTGAWQWANWLFASGIWATLSGMVPLTVLISRRIRHLLVPVLALVLVTGATVLWTVNLTFRLTVTTSVAGQDVPGWYPYLSAWVDAGLLNAAGLVGGSAFALFGVATLLAPVVARWTGWFALGCGLLLIGEVVLTRDVIPALFYLAPLPIGLAALIRGVRVLRTKSASST